MTTPPILSRYASVSDSLNLRAHVDERTGDDRTTQLEIERLHLLQLEKRYEIEKLLNERLKLKGAESELFEAPESIESTTVGGARLMASLVERLELPRVEMLRFDGNPLQYWRFIRNFEVSVESKTEDNYKRLTCLIQQCDGVARNAIESCVILESIEGYHEARKILQDRFGQNFMIARSHIDRLLNMPPLRAQDTSALSELTQQLSTTYMTLTQMQYESDLNAHTTIRSIVSKLPSHLKFKWAEVAAQILQHGREANFHDLLEFVKERARVYNTEYGQLASARTTDDNPVSPGSRNRTPKLQPRGSTFAIQGDRSTDPTQPGRLQCLACGQPHFLDQCEDFIHRSVTDRFQFVKEHKLCLLCLKPNHITKTCRLRRFCTREGCGSCHHTLLHRDVSPTSSIVASTMGARKSVTKSVALGIVPVIVHFGGRSTHTCAFIDPGSDTTLASDSLVSRLNMQGTPTNVSITTVTHESMLTCTELQFHLSAPSSIRLVHVPRAWSVKRLPPLRRILPSKRQLEAWQHLQEVQFTTAVSQDVELLVGSDVPEAHWVIEQRLGKPNEPYAVRTALGWMFLGPLNQEKRNASVNCLISEEINRNLTRLYDRDFCDSENTPGPCMSVNDREALSIMQSSITHRNGHYEVALPWKQNTVSLPDNRKMAETRLWQLLKRFKKSPELESRYNSVMADYIQSGFAEVVPKNATSAQRIWYLPHHPVLHPAKPDKVRVVFDCASQFNGYALNQQLLSGPDLVNNMLGVLWRFRWKPIAVVSDIEAMFHQVRIPECDRDALRFLWWSNGDKSKPPEVFRMCVHLFGATSSPSCASFALQQTITDNTEKFPAIISQLARSNFYVDDCLASYATETEAIQCSTHLKGLLQLGGFNLTKWVSNQPTVAQQLSAKSDGDAASGSSIEHHILGINWNLKDDQLRLRLPSLPEKLTKRTILSFLAMIYDPIGMVAPVVLIAKFLFQRVCREKTSWDDPLSATETAIWVKWSSSINSITEISLPRCLLPKHIPETYFMQLHIFSDACETGYGSVVYLRLSASTFTTTLHFLYGKARVTPNKPVTIPRLELAAATLSVKMAFLVRTELDLLDCPVTFWTDSLIVLHSIKNETKRFPVYVTNRLCVIRDLSAPSDWRYVPSKLNPADMASRGFYADDRKKSKRWLNGPEFLTCEHTQWPVDVNHTSDEPDWALKANVALTTTERNSNLFISKFVKYKSWLQLQRAIAWLLRFVVFTQRARRLLPTFPRRLSTEELETASKLIIKLVQADAFAEELRYLLRESKTATCNPNTAKQRKAICLRRSSIYNLNPVMVDGILRVGGRLQNAPIPFEAKHPAILPRDSFVTRLIIQHYHEHNGHVGLEHVISLIRERFWIIRCRTCVKRIISDCFVCKLFFAPPCQQVMAPLPFDRVSDDPNPFSTVGVDYFGPLYVRRGRAVEKRYGCLFTCLKFRAVHIEVAHSLDTNSFLCAVSRFASRRGFPRRFYSDNGSNFRGAENDVLALIRSLDQEVIAARMLNNGCDWIFNPPNASHRGGVWERLVRSIKRLMLVVFSEVMMTDEVLQTSLVEIERILNDRPLTKLSDNPDDQTVLTPSKLLLLRGIPSTSNEIQETYLNRRWRQVQHLTEMFWRQWLKQYLPSLNVIPKWQRDHRNLRVGDLVLLLDYSLPRGQWPKGVVDAVVVSDDGYVREATVRTKNTTVRRDVRQLCLLEEQLINSP